jgi:pimeloyl-ACP methyl ester carboxylesterase
MPNVVSDGVRIHYRIEGIGPPLVLQHGFTDSGETLFEFGYVESLKNKFKVIVPDTRGHGRSDKPHHAGAYTPADFAGDIVAILDALGIKKAFYWGYSQGGWIGFALAQHAAGRMAGFLIGGAAGGGSAYQAEAGKEDPLIAILQRGAGESLKVWANWMTPALEQRLRSNDAAALIACRRQRLMTEGYSGLDRIAVPTLLYAGDADPIHDGARRTASQIPGSAFVSLPGFDHVGAMCRPDLIMPQAIRFLEAAG